MYIIYKRIINILQFFPLYMKWLFGKTVHFETPILESLNILYYRSC